MHGYLKFLCVLTTNNKITIHKHTNMEKKDTLQAHINTRKRTHTCVHTHARARAYTHTRTHTHTHTHTHTEPSSERVIGSRWQQYHALAINPNSLIATHLTLTHLGFVHPLQDVALQQRLPLSSVCCFPVPGGFLLPMLCRLATFYLVVPLISFLLGCHSVQRLVHLLPFILAICPVHFQFCFCVCSIMPIVFVLFLISEHGILSCRFKFNIFLSIALWAVLSMFVSCLCLTATGHCW